MKPDYYKILKIGRNASSIEIKKAYRSLAMRYHPDRNPEDADSEEKFKWITKAYEVLKDPEKRAAYDRNFFAFHNTTLLSDVKSGGGFFYPPANDFLGDFFKGFFRQHGQRKPKSQKGSDLRYNLKISFQEAALGTETEIKVPYQSECPLCHGTGSKFGTKPIVCPTCLGKGEVKKKKGFFEAYQTCKICNGEGFLITSPCKRCKGLGTVQSRYSLSIPIAPGVETGTRLRIKGQGMPGSHGGKPGDLFVVVHVKKHPLFEREGLNVVCTVPIPFYRAILGGRIEIPVLEGKTKIKIPQGCQHGKTIRIHGKGIPSGQHEKRGDFIVNLQVEMPKRLSEKEMKLLRVFEKTANFAAYPDTLKFMKKMDTFYNKKR